MCVCECCVAVVLVGQVEKIASLSASQSCEGLEVVNDLPDRGRGVKAHNQSCATTEASR